MKELTFVQDHCYFQTLSLYFLFLVEVYLLPQFLNKDKVPQARFGEQPLPKTATLRKGTLRIYMQKRYFTCSVLMKYCSTESFNIIILYFVHVLLNTISPIIYQSKSCKRMYKNNTRENVSRIIFRLSNFEMKIILAFFLPLLRRNPECLPKY